MRTELTSPLADVAPKTPSPQPADRPGSATQVAAAIRTLSKPVSDAAHAPAPAPTSDPPVSVAISVDANRNTIYRFLDQRTGDLIRQVPPEEVLRVMRSIEQMLQASQQKVKVDA